MAVERADAPPADLTLTVTLSAQPAFFDAVAAAGRHLGEQAGCATDEAASFGEGVGLALGRVTAGAPADAVPDELVVVFHVEARWLRADISCGRTRQGRPFPLEQAIAEGDGLAVLQSKADRVEVIQTQGRACCRLTRRIRPR
jgi:hypothetical protein